MIELVNADRQALTLIMRLYKDSFPINERKPFPLILRKRKEGVVEILAVNDEGDFVGFAITVKHKDTVLLDYYAFDESKRGRGYGSATLKLLKERYSGKKLILEIEAPDIAAKNSAQRIKRKSFYLKNGFIDSGLSFSVYGVTMILLKSGDYDLKYEDYLGAFKISIGKTLYKFIKPKKIN